MSETNNLAIAGEEEIPIMCERAYARWRTSDKCDIRRHNLRWAEKLWTEPPTKKNVQKLANLGYTCEEKFINSLPSKEALFREVCDMHKTAAILNKAKDDFNVSCCRVIRAKGYGFEGYHQDCEIVDDILTEYPITKDAVECIMQYPNVTAETFFI